MEPVPVSHIDANIPKTLHRARWYTVTLIIGVLLICTGLLAAGYAQQRHQLSDQHREIAASCGWWETVGELPVTVPPGGKVPTRTNIVLLAESRNAFIMQDCEGRLMPPSSPLLHWARVYRVELLG